MFMKGVFMEKNTIKRLEKIRVFSFLLLIIAITWITLTDNMIIGSLIVILALLIQWKFYICPSCNKSLDARLKLTENTYCPNCGNKIK